MSAATDSPASVYLSALVNYLVAMARTVEANVNKSLDALLEHDARRASEVFLAEPRINEMEVIIDDHAVRLLREGGVADDDLRFIVASIKINNDLERMGDLAVNIGQRVLSLAALPGIENPVELEPMASAVRSMVGKVLGALIFRNVDLANEVLESDDLVDTYRDHIFERLLAAMNSHPEQVTPNIHFVLATRHLERIADHATNIAEDIVFWLRGLDVRHGRLRELARQDAPPLL
jgi:phosphate transport system protein